MLQLWVIYANDPGYPMVTPIKLLESTDRAQVNAAFEEAAEFGDIDDRAVMYLWTIDTGSEQGDVAVRAYPAEAAIFPFHVEPQTKFFPKRKPRR